MTKKINLRTILQYVVPPVITVGLCFYLYRDVDWTEVRHGLASCRYGLLALFLALNVLAMLFRAMRWRLQLRAIGLNPSLPQMNRSIFGTYAVNLVFPRLGEFWRCTYMARVTSAPFSSVFGSMVADRLADTLAVGLITLLAFAVSTSAMAGFLSRSNLDPAFLGSAWMIALYVVILACALLIWRGKGKVFTTIRAFFLRMWHGFAAVFTMRRRGLWLLLTLGIWGSYFGSMAVSMLAFPPTAALFTSLGSALSIALVTFVFGSLAMAIPSNGGIGPWQFAIILSLNGIYGLPRPEALTFATINLAFTTLLTIALGLYTFATLNFPRKK